MRRSALAALVLATGCATARADIHAASATALGLIHAAQANPELVAEVKDGLSALATKVDPKDAPAVNAALDHVNAGNLDKAAALVSPLVAASAAPVTSASK